MKPIDYLYFNIYNHFHRRSFDSRGFHARIQAMYLFSLFTGGWVLFLEAVYLRMFKHCWFASKPGAAIFASAVYLLTVLILNQIFIVNERDRAIYGKYEEKWDANPKKRRDLFISIFAIAIPYLFLVTLAILFPRHI
jgi:hypothetical protein